jgi:hypothetical protein
VFSQQLRRVAVGALSAAVLLLLFAAWPARAEPRSLTGTFALTPGACPAGTGAGSYFRMVQPSGSIQNGPFVANGDSGCSDQTFTLLQPGTDGGLASGAYQPAPNPVFDAAGNSLATRIAAPTTFFGVAFGLSADPTELQSKKSVPAITISESGGVLSADLRAFTASWNSQYFNQGAPKADGSSPGLTTKAKGTLDPSSGAFVLEWASTVVGGPFNDFTGAWHLEGVFHPAGTNAPAAATASSGSSTKVTTVVPGAATQVLGEQVEQAAGTTDTTIAPSGGGAPVAIAAQPSKGWRPPAWLILATALVGITASLGVIVPFRRDEDGDDAPPPPSDPPAPRKRKGPRVAALAIGVGLALAPVGFQMFTRAPKGGDMITSFKPYMRTEKIDNFSAFIGDIRAANAESQTALAALPPAERASYPGVTALNDKWPGIDADMTEMLTTMRADIGNYKGVAALPPFPLFPWFFVAPGLLIAGVAGWSLAKDRERSSKGRAIALAALGVGLIAAPAVFQMFTRAPGGAEMINDFKPLMQPAKVTRIQGYFLTIGLAEGELRNKLVPAQSAAGRALPESTTLSAEWPEQSGEMAPMIAAMADNLDNFNAVVALPPFWLFPWFFVFPGILVAALAFVSYRTKEDTAVNKIIGFPNPVNEVSARLVATGVVLMATTTVLFDTKWVLPILFYGFVARVLTGPKLSPLGQLVTRVITPRLPFKEKLVAGPPKRFAQGMGVAFSGIALLLALTGHWFAGQVVLGMLIFAASLEAFVGICLGCKIFAIGMRLGWVPEEVCEACNNVGDRIKDLKVAA